MLAAVHEGGSAVSVIATLTALALGAGGFLAYLRVGMQRTTTDLWKQQSQALQASVDRLEEENSHLEHRIGELEVHNLTLKHEIEVLKDLATGQHAVAAIEEILLRQHEEVMDLLRKIAHDRRHHE